MRFYGPGIGPRAGLHGLCIAGAAVVREQPHTNGKVAAHALFLRCIDHFRAAVTLGTEGFDVEALALTRGISETLFVIGALLKGLF